MTLIAILFVVGLILLAVEVIVPGGLLGVLGGVSLIAGCVLAFLNFGSRGGVVAVAVAVTLTALLLVIEFLVLPKTRLGKKMFLRAQIAGTSQPMPGTVDLIGQAAVAATTLAPSGYVQVAGKRYEAFCRSGFVEAGATLKVVAMDNFRLIVSTP